MKRFYKTPIHTRLHQRAILDGTLKSKESVIVSGKFTGSIESDAALQISETGSLTGNASSHDMSISGKVEGNLNAQTMIALHPPCAVHGTLDTPRISVSRGALFQGNLHTASHRKT